MVDWKYSNDRIEYTAALEIMEAHVDRMINEQADELIWCLEHHSIYTRGTSGQDHELINQLGFPVIQVGRGGRFTYHGPGQRVIYAMINLRARNLDVRAYVDFLERWTQNTLADFSVHAEPRKDRVGLWVKLDHQREDKIAAIGVRIRRGIAFHGIAINVEPDLSHFEGITPCGIDNPLYGVTSLHQLGCLANFTDIDLALKKNFEQSF